MLLKMRIAHKLTFEDLTSEKAREVYGLAIKPKSLPTSFYNIFKSKELIKVAKARRLKLILLD